MGMIEIAGQTERLLLKETHCDRSDGSVQLVPLLK